MLKRIADWLEKASVAGFAVGVFQDKPFAGLLVAIGCLALSLILTNHIQWEDNPMKKGGE
ncbi:MAG: hypothetical protein LBV80_09955 [Deltaproteobacteria bacterium]|jgi:hypothetical protein|nr:hypothetical protein [Deltaproteobacteria bacterium]